MSASLQEIDAAVKRLLKRWHPDLNPVDKADLCNAKTREILEAQALLEAYCEKYRYSFERQEVEKYLPPDEWWVKRFASENPRE
ncbi:putative heat shock protein DnaJ domain-containing protein [Magnetofaba australis IT-1]|uniref:Putative heat shock protein DnaJ domain-containing protein n=2 Tax=Magnetofaba TaxID=1472292 RepID=A0A1Y2K7N1_9PROT|nr:putative heat shock protein DnaJ domain-containing protein [Magnetofaba australis IT-1]